MKRYRLPRYLRLRHPPSLRFGETGAYGGQVGGYDVASISTAWINLDEVWGFRAPAETSDE